MDMVSEGRSDDNGGVKKKDLQKSGLQDFHVFELVTLEDMKIEPALSGMMVLKKGSRLSVQPVEKKHFDKVVALGRKK